MEHSTEFPDCFHRVTIKGLYVKDGKVLLMKEGEVLSGKWEMPGGGLDFGEDIQEGFKREITEEMNLKVIKMSDKPVYVWTYKYENKRNLKWYYSLVLAYRIELESLDFTPTEECTTLGFFSKEELQNIELNGQTTKLSSIFNPEDFEDSF
jgi:8-oxo-dGTP diphosphatase